jgi:hypothetical protein
VTKNVDVAEVFNNFFVNVAQDIGKDYTFNKNYHPSLQKIEDKNFVKNSFEFKSTNETFVSKVIKIVKNFSYIYIFVTILSLFCKIILD